MMDYDMNIFTDVAPQFRTRYNFRHRMPSSMCNIVFPTKHDNIEIHILEVS